MIDPQWEAVQRVVAVRLDNLGDVVVTTPALHAIKQTVPGVHLTLLTSSVGAQVGRLNPDCDDVIVYEAPWMDPWRQLSQDSGREQGVIETLKGRRFDAAIIFTSFRQSSLPAAYLCYLADVPLRLAASTDGPGSLLTTRHKHPDRMMHEVERGLDLVGAVGLGTDDVELSLAVPAEERFRAQEILRGIRMRPDTGPNRGIGPVIVLHPGCSMPARTYPWEMYAEVADLAIERLNATVILTGTRDERDLAHRVRSRMHHVAVDLAGELSFERFCALIEAADLTITNNTGPMHISAAVKTPVVALFALTNPPEQWAPWRVSHRQLFHDVPCRICYSRVCPFEQQCLRLVSPETVVEAAAELLAEVPEAAASVGGRR